MLQGTFETLALTDLLALLAHSHKSGALWLEAGPITAAVHFDDGRCVAAESAELIGPVVEPADLLVRIVDVCFAVARQPDGAFRFATGDVPPWVATAAIDVADAISELEHVLAEWDEIRVVIPSLECRPRLLDDLGIEELIVDRERWTLLVAIDGDRTVSDIVQRTGRPLLDLCRAVVALIEAGAASVTEISDDQAGAGTEHAPDGEPDPAASVAAGSDTEIVEPADPYGPGVEVNGDAAGAPAAEATAEPEGERPPTEKRDKGAFLSLFSALRDD